MLKELKRLHDLGFSLIYLKPKSKAPIEGAWTSGPKKSWGELKKKFKSSYNIGVRLGETSFISNSEGGGYLAVIDCDVKSKDPKHQKEMNKQLLVVSPLKAPVVVSGRGHGSCHIYILTPKPAQPGTIYRSKEIVKVHMPSASRISEREQKELTPEEIKKGIRLRAAWEISLMGEGQQVVLPPSIHPDSGKKYEWAIPLISGEELKTCEFAAFKKEKKKEYEVDADFKQIDISKLDKKWIDMIIKGAGASDRSACLLSVTKIMLAKGFSEDEILSVLTEPKYYLGQTGYDHTQSRSRKRAAEWVAKHTLFKAAKSMSAEVVFLDEDLIEPTFLDEEDAEIQTQEMMQLDWRTRVQRNYKDGKPKVSLFNIELILNKNFNGPICARDTFLYTEFWLQDMPWGSKKGQQLTDDDTRLLRSWLASHWRVEPSEEKVNTALINIAVRNSYHPVQNYLNGLTWDGTPRIKNWLTTYLGARKQPKEYLQVVGEQTLLAMVARIYEPGIKYDQMLILEGKQELGKSSTVEILATKDWFSDTELDIGNKDAIMNMQGVWVYEIGELSAMSRFEVNRIKQFISSSVDKIRPPFGKRTIAFPRQSIFIGTTNNKEYLKDKTGNRRYYPAETVRLHRAELVRDRDQLLAEAVHMYAMGANLWVSDPGLKKLIRHEQSLRVEHDEIEDQLEEFLNKPVEPFPANNFRICDLLEHGGRMVMGLKNDKPTHMRLATALRSLGYEKTKKRINGTNAWWWQKVEI